MQRIFYGWYILAAASVILFFSTGIGLYSLPVFILPLEEYFGATRTALSAFAGVLFFVSGLSGLWIGHLVHRFGPRKVMIVSAASTSIGYVALSQAQTLWHLFVLGLPVAVGIMGISMLPIQTLVSHWFEAKRGRAVGITMMSMALGGIVWAPLSHALIQRLTWQVTYMVFGATLLGIIWPLCFWVIRDQPRSLGLGPDGAAKPAPATESSPNDDAKPPPPTRLTLRPVLWKWLLVTLFAGAALAVVNTHIVAMVVASPLGASQGKQAAQQFSAQLISGYLICGVFGSLIGGMLADRLSRSRLLQIGYGLLMLASLTLRFLDGTPAAYLFAVTFGLAMGSNMVLSVMFTVEKFGLTLLSRVLGINSLAATFAMALGPLLAGVWFDASGSYNGAQLAMMLCALLAIGLMEVIRHNRPAGVS